MKHRRLGRMALATLAGTALLAGALIAATGAQGTEGEHPVVGRWNVEAEPGGSVWAFQPSGLLVVSGPGEIMAEGTWEPADDDGAFDATVDMSITGQLLEVLGQVAEDGSEAALYVAATDATRPDDWTPWPPESRIVAPRFGMQPDGSPRASESPVDCLRPEWIEAGLDWDRCDDGLTDPAAVAPG